VEHIRRGQTLTDFTSIAVTLGVGIISSGGIWSLISTRLSRRDIERDRAAAAEREQRIQTDRDVSTLRAAVVRLEAQVDVMGGEYIHPDWTKDPYTGEIIECNAACRRQFFAAAGIADPRGATFAQANFAPDFLKRLEAADEIALQHGAAMVVGRPRANMPELAFIKQAGEARASRRPIIKGFAIPFDLLITGDIADLVARIEREHGGRGEGIAA